MGAPETATILFTDVEGSTDLRARVGDQKAQDLLRAQDRVVRDIVESADGRVVKALGDGVMASFASASAAVHAAAQIQRSLADDEVRLRIGLHTGEVTLEEGDLFGQAVHAAARIMGRARAGQILVSESLLGELDGLESVDRGLHWLKGFPERWRLHEVRWREDAPSRARPIRARLDRTPFVGRDAERADLRLRLEDAVAGSGSLVLLGGEPGVGKTRLAMELAAEADERGVRVLTGHCVEMEGAAPYTPWVEILEQALARAQSPEAFRSLLGDDAGEVARIVPELRRVYADVPPPLELPPEQERRYLFNSIRDFIGRAARLRPMMLVLDDLHWADEPSLLLLRHVVEGLGDLPVLVVGTYRDVELEVGRPLARAIEDLRRGGLTQRLSLKRLDEAGVAAMLEALAGQPAPPELVGVIYAESDGNAFFIEEVFRHLLEEGRLLDEAGRWRTDVSVAEFDVPESIRLVIGRRLERLSESSRKLLTCAALLGRVFEVDVLTEVARVDEDELLDGLEEAEISRLVIAQEGLGDRFGFGHELIRQTLLSEVSTLRRQRLHLRVADALEARAGEDLEPIAADLAYHLTQAGAGAPVDRTGRTLVAAGRRALDAAGFEDALRYLEAAASLVGAFDERGRAELLSLIGTAERSLGHWDRAIEAWYGALDAFEALGDDDRVALVSHDIAIQLGWAARLEDSLFVVSRGLNAIGDRITPERVTLEAIGAVLFSAAGYHDAGQEMLERAEAMARELGDDRLLGVALNYRAVHEWEYARGLGTAESGIRAAELLGGTGALWDRANSLGFAALGLALAGRHEEVDRVVAEGLPLARRVGNHAGEMCLTRAAAVTHWARTADVDAMDRAVEADYELCREAGMPWITDSITWRAIQAFRRGDWLEAVRHSREAVARDMPGVFADWHRAFLGEFLVFAGKEEEGLAVLRDGVGRLAPVEEPISTGGWTMVVSAVEAFAHLGLREEAAALYPYAVKLLANGLAFGLFGGRLTENTAGTAAGAAGDWERAEAHFEDAIRLGAKLPVRLDEPAVRHAYARMLLDRDADGDRARAGGLLEEAVEGYRRIGMPKHAELAEELRASIPG